MEQRSGLHFACNMHVGCGATVAVERCLFGSLGLPHHICLQQPGLSIHPWTHVGGIRGLYCETEVERSHGTVKLRWLCHVQ